MSSKLRQWGGGGVAPCPPLQELPGPQGNDVPVEVVAQGVGGPSPLKPQVLHVFPDSRTAGALIVIGISEAMVAPMSLDPEGDLLSHVLLGSRYGAPADGLPRSPMRLVREFLKDEAPDDPNRAMGEVSVHAVDEGPGVSQRMAATPVPWGSWH